VASLNASVEDYKKLHENFKDVEDRFKGELQKKSAQVSEIEKELLQERKRVAESREEAREEIEEAQDKLHRAERRIKVTEQDLNRSREMVEEKEIEILDLKKLIRSQNKQLESALGGSVSSGAKRSKLELEDEIEILNGQISVLKKQIAVKDQEIFDYRMQLTEMEEKSKLLVETQQLLKSFEQDRNQMELTVMDLKNQKVSLLERLDNSEHRETVMQNELALVRQEVERLKR
jgi:chromosome segregation ATPase